MKKLLIFFLFVLCSVRMGHAHNPLSAMYYLEVENDFGILNVSLSQIGVQEAIFKAYNNEEIGNLSDIEYKQIIVSYIKDNFHLAINGEPVKLLEGGVKVGNHQTDLKFLTAKLPEVFHTLNTKIDAFQENEHHQTVFSLAVHGKTSKVILNETNKYSSSIHFKDDKMIVDSTQFETKYLWFLAIIPVFMITQKVLRL